MAVPISNVVRRIVFAPSGVGPYAFTFEILAATDIEVYKGDTLLTLTTDYTVTINVNGTGSVTLVATAGTDNITIVGARTIQRTTDFVTGGDLFANSLNEELDSLTIFTQQNAEAADRSIRAPVTDPTTIDMTLPVKADRAGKYLSFNSSTGDPEVVNTVVDVTAVAANATNINTVAGISGNVTTVAGVAANVTTVAGIAANVTTVAGVAANVTTVAGISADVTTVAADGTDIGAVAAVSSDVAALGPIAADITTVAGVDSDVTAVAGIAANVTTVAGVAANVTTVAGIAANVTTVAGISADVTTVATNVADITNFSDVYLGPAATDPATRNDSSALQAGDLYFNTADDAIKVYTGSAWVAAYITAAGFVTVADAQTITGVKTFDNGLNTDTISEETAAAGVTVDGVLLKDTTITANTIKASGTSSTQGEVQLFEDTDNGTNYVAFKAPASIAADVTWTLPNADGTADQVLKTDGSGALGWATAGGASNLGDGSETTPSVNFSADTNTGIYRPGNDRLGFATNGALVGEFDGTNLKFNSGYGSVATAYGCRAWVNFNGTGTPAIREDGNVSSITDNNTGDYTINFTTAMPDRNYAVFTEGNYGSGSGEYADPNGIWAPYNQAPTTSTVRIGTRSNSNFYDYSEVNVAIFR